MNWFGKNDSISVKVAEYDDDANGDMLKYADYEAGKMPFNAII